MTNCGPGGSGTESCCTSLEVTNDSVDGGISYYRTYANDGGGPTGEADPATVSGFRLDKYLVTVGRFRQFVMA
jgi:formylglycine-generating enzyme